MKKFTVEISGEALRTLQREADYEYLQDYLELQKMIEYVIRGAHEEQQRARLKHVGELGKHEVIVDEAD